MVNKALQEKHKEHCDTHTHEPLISLAGVIMCRTCGETMPSYEEEITRMQSKVRARRTLDEIGASGKYTAISSQDVFVVYGKVNEQFSNLYEKVFVRKLGERSYAVIRSTEDKNMVT